MKTYRFAKFATMVLTLLCATAFAAAQPQHPTPVLPAPTHTGTWWEAKSDLYKEAFIGGYKAGAKTTAGHPVDINKFRSDALIDGLNHFYRDFRNNNIVVEDALGYIAEQLRGDPDDKLSAELHRMRAAAASTSTPE